MRKNPSGGVPKYVAQVLIKYLSPASLSTMPDAICARQCHNAPNRSDDVRQGFAQAACNEDRELLHLFLLRDIPFHAFLVLCPFLDTENTVPCVSVPTAFTFYFYCKGAEIGYLSPTIGRFYHLSPSKCFQLFFCSYLLILHRRKYCFIWVRLPLER